ncbi:MAG: glycoside hydrolase family 10 protein, partial [Planctomycetota bacterium JB042]
MIVRPLALLALPLAALASSGCATPPPRGVGPVRALWVTRFDYRTADDVRRIVRETSDAGFDTLMFQVRGNGTAFWRSALEPWADELGGRDPGFDPLAVAVEAAHARGMELHAWVNVMPSWRGATPPSNPAQLYLAHPDWHWYDRSGTRQPLVDGFYVSLNPCLPEVRRYLVDVCREIVAGYEVDGLHLDYVRFVDDLVEKDDYPRDPRTVALFHAEHGRLPRSGADREFDRWKGEQVTKLVRALRAMVDEERPDVVLSAAVGAVPEGPADRHHRDSAGWAREGLVDAVFPMNYTADPAEFARRADAWRRL